MNSNNFRNVLNNIRKIIRNIPVKAKIIFVAIIILALICWGIIIAIKESQKQKYVEYDGENLKESKYPGYKELIDKLKEEHPNWTFTLFYTKLDWEEVI